jgi:hypothetical protein
MKRCFYRLLSTAVVLGAVTSTPSIAAEPGWSPVVIATGEYRQQLQATPIELRPYRPFHFYGNTVRRRYYGSNIFSTNVLCSLFSARLFN